MSKYTNPNFSIFAMGDDEGGAAVQAMKDPRGHADDSAFFNAAARVSREVTDEGLDPGVVRSGKGAGAPYYQKSKGILKVKCSKWNSEGGCTVGDFVELVLFSFLTPFFSS
jgi:hypothetical protein